MERLLLSSLFSSEIEGEKNDDPNFKIKTPSPKFSPFHSLLRLAGMLGPSTNLFPSLV